MPKLRNTLPSAPASAAPPAPASSRSTTDVPRARRLDVPEVAQSTSGFGIAWGLGDKVSINPGAKAICDSRYKAPKPGKGEFPQGGSGTVVGVGRYQQGNSEKYIMVRMDEGGQVWGFKTRDPLKGVEEGDVKNTTPKDNRRWTTAAAAAVPMTVITAADVIGDEMRTAASFGDTWSPDVYDVPELADITVDDVAPREPTYRTQLPYRDSPFEMPSTLPTRLPAPSMTQLPQHRKVEPDMPIRDPGMVNAEMPEARAAYDAAAKALKDFKKAMKGTKKSPEQKAELARLEQAVQETRETLLGPEMLSRQEHVEQGREDLRYTEQPPEGRYKSPIQPPKPEKRYGSPAALGVTPNAGSKTTPPDFATGVKNILSVYEKAGPEHRGYGEQWYPIAHQDAQNLAKMYDVPVEVAAGVIAAMSPNAQWDQNIFAAQQVLRGWGREVVDAMERKDKAEEEFALAKIFPDVFTDPRSIGGGAYATNAAKAQAMVDAYRSTGSLPAIFGREGASFFTVDTPEEFAQKVDELIAGGASVRAPGIKKPEKPKKSKNAAVDSFELQSENPEEATVQRDMPFVNVKPKSGSVDIEQCRLPNGKYGFWAFSPLGGKKVNNFYHNIATPEKSADNPTVDGHAYNIYRGTPASLSNDTQVPPEMYHIVQDAYREAGKKVGISAQAMQAITWTLWRDMLKLHYKDKKSPNEDDSGVGGGGEETASDISADDVVADEAGKVAQLGKVEETREYKVTADPEFLDRLEKLLAGMQYAGHAGSGIDFTFYVDGDGNDRPTVEGLTNELAENDALRNSGAGSELNVNALEWQNDSDTSAAEDELDDNASPADIGVDDVVEDEVALA